VVALVPVVPLAPPESVEPLVPPVAVVELAPEPLLGPGPELEPEFDIVVEDAPIFDVVVVALAGPLAPAGVDGSAARTGEIATSPTMPAASGNRNRRCMPAS
jgi:hypothetical protein